jgi:hypothetical protein
LHLKNVFWMIFSQLGDTKIMSIYAYKNEIEKKIISGNGVSGGLACKSVCIGCGEEVIAKLCGGDPARFREASRGH